MDFKTLHHKSTIKKVNAWYEMMPEKGQSEDVYRSFMTHILGHKNYTLLIDFNICHCEFDGGSIFLDWYDHGRGLRKELDISLKNFNIIKRSELYTIKYFNTDSRNCYLVVETCNDGVTFEYSTSKSFEEMIKEKKIPITKVLQNIDILDFEYRLLIGR